MQFCSINERINIDQTNIFIRIFHHQTISFSHGLVKKNIQYRIFDIWISNHEMKHTDPYGKNMIKFDVNMFFV